MLKQFVFLISLPFNNNKKLLNCNFHYLVNCFSLNFGNFFEKILKFPMEISLNNFTFELFTKLAYGKETSTAFSPYSLYIALSLVLAISNGPARTEVLNAFHFDPATTSESIVEQLKNLISQIEKETESGMISGANSIWTEKDLLSKLPQNSFDVLSPLEASLNLTSFPQPGVNEINQYVKEKTHGLIPELLKLKLNHFMVGAIHLIVN